MEGFQRRRSTTQRRVRPPGVVVNAPCLDHEGGTKAGQIQALRRDTQSRSALIAVNCFEKRLIDRIVSPIRVAMQRFADCRYRQSVGVQKAKTF